MVLLSISSGLRRRFVEKDEVFWDSRKVFPINFLVFYLLFVHEWNHLVKQTWLSFWLLQKVCALAVLKVTFIKL